MYAITQQEILDAFRGLTRSELKRVTFPDTLSDTDFERLVYFGWQDSKIPRRAYVAVPTDDGLVCLLLTRAEARPRKKTMCSWCRDVSLSSEVVQYSVRRGGAAGRKGDTIGVLICEDFACSAHARKLPPAYHKATDVDAIREENLAELRRRVVGFVTEVRSTEG